MMLKVQNLSCARGGVPLLGGVDLTLDAGEVTVLRGPNGIGKTTLLRTIAGLQPALSGQISAAPDAIAYAAHADGIKPTLSVAENLGFWAAIHGHRDIDAAIAAFDLAPLRHRAAGRLSAGQKRRLGLARLLVTNRPLWALDEPTVSLDRDAVAMFADVVARHLAAGGAALIATHIDLGLPNARTMDLMPYRATASAPAADEAFL